MWQHFTIDNDTSVPLEVLQGSSPQISTRMLDLAGPGLAKVCFLLSPAVAETAVLEEQ